LNMGQNDQKNKKSYDILLVEDEEKNLRLLKKTLKSADQFDCNITTAGDGKKGLEYIKENHYDIVISDYQMPKMNGVDFLNKVNEKYPSDTVKFLITGHGNMDVIKRAINEAEIHQFIEKPWEADELRSIIYQVMELKEEREKEGSTDLGEVEEALETVREFQQKMTDRISNGIKEEKLIFEFDSSSQFNNFSFKLKDLKNATLTNVERNESKYIVSVKLFPDSYRKIR